MKTGKAIRFAFVALACALVPAAAAAQDVTPPRLVEFAFAPDTIDVSGGPAQVTVAMRLTDDLAGFRYGYVWFVSPSGQQYARANFWESERTWGDAIDGRYEAAATLAQYSEGGTWLFY